MRTWLWSPMKGLGRGDASPSKLRKADIRVLGSCFLTRPRSCFTSLSCFSSQGIQYLIEHQVLSSDLQEIARFLHKGEGLNKTAIGDYLGGR